MDRHGIEHRAIEPKVSGAANGGIGNGLTRRRDGRLHLDVSLPKLDCGGLDQAPLSSSGSSSSGVSDGNFRGFRLHFPGFSRQNSVQEENELDDTSDDGFQKFVMPKETESVDIDTTIELVNEMPSPILMSSKKRFHQVPSRAANGEAKATKKLRLESVTVDRPPLHSGPSKGPHTDRANSGKSQLTLVSNDSFDSVDETLDEIHHIFIDATQKMEQLCAPKKADPSKSKSTMAVPNSGNSNVATTEPTHETVSSSGTVGAILKSASGVDKSSQASPRSFSPHWNWPSSGGSPKIAVVSPLTKKMVQAQEERERPRPVDSMPSTSSGRTASSAARRQQHWERDRTWRPPSKGITFLDTSSSEDEGPMLSKLHKKFTSGCRHHASPSYSQRWLKLSSSDSDPEVVPTANPKSHDKQKKKDKRSVPSCRLHEASNITDSPFVMHCSVAGPSTSPMHAKTYSPLHIANSAATSSPSSSMKLHRLPARRRLLQIKSSSDSSDDDWVTPPSTQWHSRHRRSTPRLEDSSDEDRASRRELCSKSVDKWIPMVELESSGAQDGPPLDLCGIRDLFSAVAAADNDDNVTWAGKPERPVASSFGSGLRRNAWSNPELSVTVSIDSTVDEDDAIRQIEQIESDEAYARVLQAQFDAELTAPPRPTSPLLPTAPRDLSPDVTYVPTHTTNPAPHRYPRSRPSTRITATGSTAHRVPRPAAVRQPTTRSPTQQSLMNASRHRVGSGRTRGSHDSLNTLLPTIEHLVSYHGELVHFLTSIASPNNNNPGPHEGTRSSHRRRPTGGSPRRRLSSTPNMDDLDLPLAYNDLLAYMAAQTDDEDERRSVGVRRRPIPGGAGSRRRTPRRVHHRVTGAGANIAVWTDNDDNDYEELLELAERLGHVSRGLTHSEVNRLPTRVYGRSDSAQQSKTECHICMCDYEAGDRLRILPCFHEFHTGCIDRWLVEKNTCPVCRLRVQID